MADSGDTPLGSSVLAEDPSKTPQNEISPVVATMAAQEGVIHHASDIPSTEDTPKEEQRVRGIKLVLIITSMIFVQFVVMLDLSIVATVNAQQSPFSTGIRANCYCRQFPASRTIFILSATWVGTVVHINWRGSLFAPCYCLVRGETTHWRATLTTNRQRLTAAYDGQNIYQLQGQGTSGAAPEHFVDQH